jgi:hypothetical protein
VQYSLKHHTLCSDPFVSLFITMQFKRLNCQEGKKNVILSTYLLNYLTRPAVACWTSNIWIVNRASNVNTAPTNVSAVETNAATSVVTVRHAPWHGTVYVFRVRCRWHLFADVISTLLARELPNERFTLKYALWKIVLKLYNFQFTCDT